MSIIETVRFLTVLHTNELSLSKNKKDKTCLKLIENQTDGTVPGCEDKGNVRS